LHRDAARGTGSPLIRSPLREEAGKILTVGAAKADEKIDAVELAAYTGTANVLLNLDEVVTRE
jgi:hypothetical protein